MAGAQRAPIAPDLALSQAEPSEMAKASRHLISRTLSGFKRRGWVALRYSRIALTDCVALYAFASGAA